RLQRLHPLHLHAFPTRRSSDLYRSLLPEDFAAFQANAAVKTLAGESPVIRYLVFNMCSTADFALLKCPLTTVFSDANGALIRKRSEEHTSELQSRVDLVCRLLL